MYFLVYRPGFYLAGKQRRSVKTAIKTFQELTELKLFTEDAAKAVEARTRLT
jgi:hypothetical protein